MDYDRNSAVFCDGGAGAAKKGIGANGSCAAQNNCWTARLPAVNNRFEASGTVRLGYRRIWNRGGRIGGQTGPRIPHEPFLCPGHSIRPVLSRVEPIAFGRRSSCSPGNIHGGFPRLTPSTSSRSDLPGIIHGLSAPRSTTGNNAETRAKWASVPAPQSAVPPLSRSVAS